MTTRATMGSRTSRRHLTIRDTASSSSSSLESFSFAASSLFVFDVFVLFRDVSADLSEIPRVVLTAGSTTASEVDSDVSENNRGVRKVFSSS